MDYYLKTTSKEAFIEDLQRININIQLTGNYYQDSSIIIDWIGLIPADYNSDLPEDFSPLDYLEESIYSEETLISDFEDIPYPEPPTPIIYKDGQFVNIRSIEELDITQFQNTSEVYPDIPYRMFS
jgi:hypothetical protein